MASDDHGDSAAHGEGVKLTKATERALVDQVKAKAGILATSFTTSASIAIYRETRTILDMSPERATAAIEMKRMEFAVPEQERTRRSMQQTIRLSIASAVVVVFGFLAYSKPEAGSIMVGLAGLLSGGILFSEFFNREKRRDPSRQKAP